MDNNLSNIISVISIKNSKPITGVVTFDPSFPDLYSILYPLKMGSDAVLAGGGGGKLVEVKNIRPATEEEIKAWRKADGVGKSARAKANTVDKVKGIKWVDISLMNGETIITNLCDCGRR